MLLAARNVAIGGRVFGPHHQDVACWSEERRDIAGERRVAAFVPADHDAVDPNRSAIIDRAKIEPDALAGPFPGESKSR